MTTRGQWLVFAVLLLVCASGYAQTTGAIHGQAADHEGKALPGVTVKLTGDRIPGDERVAVSDQQGNFKYSALPVGNYSMTASLTGFKSEEVAGVRVTIDGVSLVTFRLQPESFAGEVVVTTETPLVDPASTSVSTNYSAEFVQSLPTRNNFYDIMSVAPAMSQPNEGSAYFSGYGGNVTSQQWNIDGLNLASPEGGWLSWNINPDIVLETSLKGFGAGAEYGSTSGNVYNVVTKSGSNQFHGDITAYLQNNNFVDPNVTLNPADLYDYRLWDPAGEYTIDDFYDYRVSLGGPIVRDRMWFFAGAQWEKSNVVSPTAVNGIPGSGATADRYDLKLSAQLSSNYNHRLDVRGHLANGDSVPPPTMYQELSNVQVTTADTKMVTGDYTWVASDNTLLNVRAGWWNRDQKIDSRTGSDEEALLDDTYPGPALNFGGIFWFSSRKEDSTQVDAELTQYADNFIAGSHEFKFGVQYSSGTIEIGAANSSFVWKQPPSPAYWWYDYWAFRFQIVPPIIYGADSTTKGAFASDTWQISDKWTIDLGVRYDDQKGSIPSYPRLDVDGNPTDEMLPSADMVHWKNWAPRLGFAWNPRGDGRTVIRGFAGLFWDGPVSASWYYPPPGRGNTELLWVYPWPFLPPISSVPATPSEELLLPDVQNPHTWQYALSFDQQIGNDYAIGAQLVYKDSQDNIGWWISDDGYCNPFLWDDPYTPETESIELCEIYVQPTLRRGNGPGPGSLAPDATYHLNYKGGILTFRKRYSDHWDLMASYTYSKTEGVNPRPHENGSLGQGTPSFSGDTGSDPNDWYNSEHLLQGDRTHMFRVQSNVDVGWGLRLSGVLNLQSGRPYLRTEQVVGPTTGQAITVTADDSPDLRMPSQAILDLGVQKTFNLGKDVGLQIGLQVLNVLNENAPEYWASWNLFPGQVFEPAVWVSPRRLQLKLGIDF
jgi:hypothetical protein